MEEQQVIFNIRTTDGILAPHFNFFFFFCIRSIQYKILKICEYKTNNSNNTNNTKIIFHKSKTRIKNYQIGTFGSSSIKRNRIH